jgi:hypothetical protein
LTKNRTPKNRKKTRTPVSSFFNVTTNPIVKRCRRLHSRDLLTYLALRRQKVKVGALKTVVDHDLEIFECVPDSDLLKEIA